MAMETEFHFLKRNFCNSENESRALTLIAASRWIVYSGQNVPELDNSVGSLSIRRKKKVIRRLGREGEKYCNFTCNIMTFEKQ